MNPLFTTVRVSPAVPPVRVSPGVPVLVEYRYTLELTVTVISDLPAMYPPIPATFNEAFAVLAAKVDEMETLFDLP
jgi:hypothetical protein